MKSYNFLDDSKQLVRSLAVLVIGGVAFNLASANEFNVEQYQLHNMLGSITNSNTSTIGSSMGFASTPSQDITKELINGHTKQEQPFVANENSIIITGAQQSVLINDVTIASGDWIVVEGDPTKHLTIGNNFGSITSPNGADITALNNADVQKTVMERVYSVPDGIYSVTTSVLANYVTTEFPEWVGSEFNDTVQIDVVTGSGNQYQIDTPFRQELNSAELIAVSGLPEPMLKPYDYGSDGMVEEMVIDTALNTGGQTGFIPVNINNIPVAGGGDITIRVTSENVGDELFPSAILVSESN